VGKARSQTKLARDRSATGGDHDDHMVTRRNLMRGAAAATGGAAATAALAGCQPERNPGAWDPTSWASVKAQFPLDKAYAQLAAFVFSCHPAPVRSRIAEHAAAADRDPVALAHGPEENELREIAAAYLDGGPDRIAFTDSTTAGLGLLYSGLKLAAGDEIVTTEHDFYATHESLRLLAARTGVTVRTVRLYDSAAEASAERMLSALAAALTPKVKVVALTWVHSGTGVRLPVRELADLVHSRTDALVCLDAVHGFGALADQPPGLGVDFFVSGCHKWLFGPRGTGLIWGTDRGWERYTPVVPSFDRAAIGAWITGRAAPLAAGRAATPGGYHTFEYRYALDAAFRFHERIGRARVAERTLALAARLKAGLGELPHVTVHTPGSPALSAGIVCCAVRGRPPGEVVRRLAEAKVIATVTPYRTELVRFGTSLATDPGDVDAAVRALRALG